MSTPHKYIVLFLLAAGIASCNKTGTLTVNVVRQSAGQPVEVAADDIVVMYRADSSIYMGYETKADGIAIFEKVDAGTYRVSAQHWDGSKMLFDEETVSIAKGKSVSANLLLQ